MEFAVDIDGTIAKFGVPGLLDHLREALRIPLLDVPSDISWHDVFTLPEVVAYKKAHRKRYQRIQDNVMGSLLVLRASTPMPHSVETLNHLTRIGSVSYVTCRGNEDGELQTTMWWLAQFGYPKPDQVQFCADFGRKLFTLMRLPSEQVMMIDDRAHEDRK